MKYNNIGEIKVSEIAFGCEGFSNQTPSEVEELVKYGFDRGINFIDFYSSDPELRTNFGMALKNLGIRNKYIIEGHICSTWKDGQYLRTRDLLETRNAFEDLLIRTQTDYIDIGMIHYVDSIEDFNKVFSGEIIEYVKDLKSCGKIRKIGMSSHNPIVSKMAVETGLIDVLLFSINPAYDIQPASEDCNELWDEAKYENIVFKIDKDREELYEICEKQNVAITVMKVYGGGDLLNEKLSPFKIALTPVECISYALTRPGVKAVMLGVKSKEELDEALKYEDASKMERNFAEKLSNLPRNNMQGKCVYCGHCAPCSVGIDIASVNKYVALVKAENEIPETVREHYKALQKYASDCIKCGACMKNCPFGVNIISKMEEAVQIFEKAD